LGITNDTTLTPQINTLGTLLLQVNDQCTESIGVSVSDENWFHALFNNLRVGLSDNIDCAIIMIKLLS